MKLFKKILIANRGDVALRILRACKELNIKTVIAHSTADVSSMPVRLADETVCIGPPESKKSYLNTVSAGYEFAQSSELCRIIHLEDLCFNAYEESLKIFNHCNQVFKKEYFVLKNKRFKNTRGNSINISLGSEHLINAPKIFQEMIEQEFSDIIDTWPKPNYLNKLF